MNIISFEYSWKYMNENLKMGDNQVKKLAQAKNRFRMIYMKQYIIQQNVKKNTHLV